MSISIRLSSDAEAKLRERADAAGEDVTSYAARILLRVARRSCRFARPARGTARRSSSTLGVVMAVEAGPHPIPGHFFVYVVSRLRNSFPSGPVSNISNTCLSGPSSFIAQRYFFGLLVMGSSYSPM